MSVKGLADLLTRETADEYVAWWKSGGTRWVCVVTTVTMTVALGSPTITVTDSAGSPVPSSPPAAPQYHPGYRYFRMSQASDDLFDSYRNMYLAFELLLSSQYPKGPESEIQWLSASLTAARVPLELDRFASRSAGDPVRWIVDHVYKSSRLPLFHAKAGRSYLSPGSASALRAELVESLDLLTRIVVRMANVWYGNHRLSGWFNLNLLNQSLEKTLAGSEFAVGDSSIAPGSGDDMSHTRFQGGIRFPASVDTTFAGEPRPNVCGTVSTAALEGLSPIQTLDVVGDSHLLIWHRLEAPLSIDGFDRLEVRVFLRSTVASQPRKLFRVY